MLDRVCSRVCSCLDVRVVVSVPTKKNYRQEEILSNAPTASLKQQNSSREALARSRTSAGHDPRTGTEHVLCVHALSKASMA